jgi:hypothetical protein
MPSKTTTTKATALLEEKKVHLTDGQVYLVEGHDDLYVVSYIKTGRMDLPAIYCTCPRGREASGGPNDLCSHGLAVRDYCEAMR